MVVKFSSGCDFRTNPPFFIFHPHSNGSCDATLFLPSFDNQPLCKEARLVHPFQPLLEKGIDLKSESGVVLNASILL